MEFEVKIWLGLMTNDYEGRPPNRILEASHIEDVDLLRELMDKQQIGDQQHHRHR